LASISANSPHLQELYVDESWLPHDLDEEAHLVELSRALYGNTHLWRIVDFRDSNPPYDRDSSDDEDTDTDGLSNVSLDHILAGIERSDVTTVSFGFGVRDLLSSRGQRIRRACTNNALRLADANDPRITDLKLCAQAGFTDADIPRVVQVLRNNTFVTKLTFSGSLMPLTNTIDEITDAGVNVLLRDLGDLAMCRVTGVDFDYCQHLSSSLVQRVEEICRKRKAVAGMRAASLRLHRPFQRLLLAQIYELPLLRADFPAELMLTIADCLKASETSPFTHANDRNMPDHRAAFEWHATAWRGGGPTGGPTGAKRQKLD
jgi:hypothetical protein